jgi:UDP-glucose 4-epimerase
LDAVERVAGTKLARRMAARRPGDPAALVADNKRILAALDWQPRYPDLDAIVSHALAWEKKLRR